MPVGYKLYKNMMPATAEKAPYLGMAIPAGSLAYDNILKEMIKAGTRMTLPTAKYFLDALYEYAAEAIAAEVVRINIGTVTLAPNIDGSFDSEDADFDPKRNSLYVGASLSQELRDLVAGIAPDFAGDKSVGTVKLRSCMDLGSQVFKTVAGLNAFRLAGENLTVPDGPDESLGFYAKDGVTKVADIEVSETDGGQWIACRLKQGAAAIPKGTYKVRLASHGLDPTDPLTVATLTVTLVEAIPEPPTIDSAREWIGVGTTRCSSSAYKPIRQFDILKVLIDNCLGATVDGHVTVVYLIPPEDNCDLNPFRVPIIDTPGAILVFDRHPVFGNTSTVIIQVVRVIDGDDDFTLQWRLWGEIEINLRPSAIKAGTLHPVVPVQ